MIQKHNYIITLLNNQLRKVISLILFLLILISCEKKEIIINGHLTNLPDGVLYLCRENNLNKIDSLEVKNGKFTFKLKSEKEPFYLTLHHIDKNNTFSFIGFPSYSTYKNDGFESSSFMSDSIVSINGKLFDNTPISYSNNGKTKFLTTSNPIKTGYQTNAFFHADGDLFVFFNKGTYNKVLTKVKEFPNSFHILYKINENRNSFSANEVENLLKHFKGDIVESETFKKLSDYNKKRFNSKNLALPMLENGKGMKAEIINKKYKKHLVIFWASWCGPCREEIPALKKFYETNKDEIEFVSISTDKNPSAWKKAMEKENMPWKQLIVEEKSKDFETLEIVLHVGNGIPFMAIIDNDLKVLKSTVGKMNESDLENFIKN